MVAREGALFAEKAGYDGDEGWKLMQLGRRCEDPWQY